MKSYIEAYQIIKEEIQKIEIGFEEVSLIDSLNRVNSEDIFSDTDLPSFDNSAMDGIVVNYREDISEWKIIGEISAGNFEQLNIDSDNAALIMTGAKIPDGGNTIIPVEDLIIENNIAILKPSLMVLYGQNIRKSGQDLKIYDVIAAKNIILKPKHISLLASCGISKVSVLKKYNIGVLATGDELVDINCSCNEDSVRASNLYTIIALIKELGMDYTSFGICRDDKELLKEMLGKALQSDIDLFITTGGVSVGKFDYVIEILKSLGAEIKFWKVNIKPGKPLLFAKVNLNRKTKLIFGLPGNPVSSFVNFQLFIRNIILETYYHSNAISISAELEKDLKKNDTKRHFIRGILKQNRLSGKYFVKGIDNQSSSNLAGLCLSNVLITVEEERINLKTGEEVECIMM